MAAQITALPTPPTRQDPTNFNDRADAFLAALPGFQSEANALSTEVNTRADNVQASDLAVLAATNITKWVSGTTYAQGAVVWSPVNGLGYRRITASGSGTTDPSSDSTNYRQVNGTGDVSTDVNGNLGVGTSSPSQYSHGGSAKLVEISNTGTSVNSQSHCILSSNSTLANSAIGTLSWSLPSISAANKLVGFVGMATDITHTSLLPKTFLQFALTDGGSLIERARIDSIGNLLVGTTLPGYRNSNSISLEATPGGYIVINHATGSPSGSVYAAFGYGATSVGGIYQIGTNSVSYNTSSDYRLKHNIELMQGALTRIAALKPVTYKWNADGSDGEGFIAHELAEVCPSAVTGEKDAVDADGKPVYQGIDTSFLVATLVAAIQEQQLLITSLTSRIEALESALAK